MLNQFGKKIEIKSSNNNVTLRGIELKSNKLKTKN